MLVFLSLPPESLLRINYCLSLTLHALLSNMKTTYHHVTFQVLSHESERIKLTYLESFVDASSDDHLLHTVHSKNIDFLRLIAQKSRLLESIPPYSRSSSQYSSITNPLLHVVQAIFMPWSLDPFLDSLQNLPIPHVARRWHCSQHAVYQSPTVVSLFLNPQMDRLNFEYVLHIGNFFKHHLTEADALTLHGLYTALDADKRPRVWTEQLTQGVTPLARHWKGTYCKTLGSCNMAVTNQSMI